MNKNSISGAVSASIVIPTWRRTESLRRTLDSLEQQTEGEFEVIVVCDGPDPETEVLVRDLQLPYPLRWKTHPENRGVGVARNTGVAAARGELILFLDDDTIPAAEWLAMHRRLHTAGGNIVGLGRLENRYSAPVHSAGEAFVRRLNDRCLAELWSKLARQLPGVEREFWVGLNSSISRQAYLDAGGCDPALLVQEEANLAVRLLQRGFKFLFDPAILISHHEAKDVAQDRARRAIAFGRSDVYRARTENAAWALSPMLRRLAGDGPLARQLQEQLCWHFPGTTQVIAELCRKMADVTRSELLLRVWAALSFSVGYWNGVKSQGITSPAAVRRLLSGLGPGRPPNGERVPREVPAR